jgi:hypothetical protein
MVEIEKIHRPLLELLAEDLADGTAVVAVKKNVGFAADRCPQGPKDFAPANAGGDNRAMNEDAVLFQNLGGRFLPPGYCRYQPDPKMAGQRPQEMKGPQVAAGVKRPGQFAGYGEQRRISVPGNGKGFGS